MPEFEIQVKRGESWRKVTTVRFDTDPSGRGHKRAAAIRKGFMQVAEWAASDQFTGRPLRLAEDVGGWGAREFRAVKGVGG